MRTIINDTCEVLFKRKRDGKVVFTADAQLASMSQSVSEERIKGGIGNRTIALLRSDKEVELQVRNATFDLEWLEMTQGVEITNETVIVYKKEEAEIGAAMDIAIEGTPVTDGDVQVRDSKNNHLEATFDGTALTAVDGEIGDKVTVLYQAEVTGKSISLEADKFAENYHVEYRTIEYDVDTNEIVNDLYFIFNNVTPSGQLDMSFENGSAIAPEISFTALNEGTSSKIGQVLEVPRVATP